MPTPHLEDTLRAHAIGLITPIAPDCNLITPIAPDGRGRASDHTPPLDARIEEARHVVWG